MALAMGVLTNIPYKLPAGILVLGLIGRNSMAKIGIGRQDLSAGHH